MTFKSSIGLTPRGGFTLPNMVISVAITTMIAAGMLTAVVALQKSTLASHHHVRSQIQQNRLIDYIARDLRRALTVNVVNTSDGEGLNLTIPDYYDTSGNPRDPVISQGGVVYGGTAGVPISYFKKDGQILRRANGKNEVLATDVQQFHIDFTDQGKQTVALSINFVPRFQFSSTNAASFREGTTTYATTLLRNKRLQ